LRRLFLSDLHLADPEGPQFRTLRAVLETARGTVDELYILGDLCEVWVGDDDDGPLTRALVDLLRSASAHMHVAVMAGNRDFLFGAEFAAVTGARLIEDPLVLPGGILLAHGDAFCIDDAPYQAMRRVVRSAEWQRDILARPLAERRALARAMRAASSATNANKAENIMDVNAGAVARAVAERDCRLLVHGHTHRPGIHTADWGRRYVLGAWDHCAWLLHQDHTGRFDLACRPLARSG
jgi:UDP-2,3-diacylglucosamine hydrolase